MGDALQSPLGKCKQQGEGGSFYGEGGFSLRNTAVLKFHCKSYWVLGTLKNTSFPYSTAFLPFFFYSDWQGQKFNLKSAKIHEINTES